RAAPADRVHSTACAPAKDNSSSDSSESRPRRSAAPSSRADWDRPSHAATPFQFGPLHRLSARVEEAPHHKLPIPKELRFDAPLPVIPKQRQPGVMIGASDFPQRFRFTRYSSCGLEERSVPEIVVDHQSCFAARNGASGNNRSAEPRAEVLKGESESDVAARCFECPPRPRLA